MTVGRDVMVKIPKVRHPPKRRMSYEEFLQWADEDVWAEWVDGEVIILTPASLKHQRIVSFLHALIKHYADATDAGEVLTAPFQMYLPHVRRGREPDIIFVAKENLHRLTENFLHGPADLVVEVISPSSAERDRVAKFREYEAGGVREYWLIDPEGKLAEFYVAGEGGRYERCDVEGDIYCSAVLEGFWLRLEWLWSEPLPRLDDVLRELRAGNPQSA